MKFWLVVLCEVNINSTRYKFLIKKSSILCKTHLTTFGWLNKSTIQNPHGKKQIYLIFTFTLAWQLHVVSSNKLSKLNIVVTHTFYYVRFVFQVNVSPSFVQTYIINTVCYTNSMPFITKVIKLLSIFLIQNAIVDSWFTFTSETKHN
jgi:hypothetical protein